MFKFTLILVAVTIVSVTYSSDKHSADANQLDISTPSGKSTKSEAQKEADKFFHDAVIDKMDEEERNRLLFFNDDNGTFSYQELLKIVRENQPGAAFTVKTIRLIFKKPKPDQ